MTRDEQDPDSRDPDSRDPDSRDPDARNGALDPEGRRALLQDLESIRTLLDELERDAAGIDLSPPVTERAPAGPRSVNPKHGSPGLADPAAHIPVLREVVRPAPARTGDAGDRVPAAARQAPSPVLPPQPRAPRASATSITQAAGPAPSRPAPAPPGAGPDAAAGSARTELQGELFDARAFADRLLDDDWRRERDAMLDVARRSARAFHAPQADPPAASRDEDDAAAAAATTDIDALRERLAAALAPRVDALLNESLASLRAALTATLHAELRRLLHDPGGSDSSPDKSPDSKPDTRNPDHSSDTAANAADRDPDETD